VIDERSLENKRRQDMTDEERVRLFQRKLYRKAKQEKEFRFYMLYDKLMIGYLMHEAWRRVKTNGGAAGYDNMSISDVIKYGVEKYLSEIAEELRTKTYKPQPVLRVFIPKANGKLRPLGIPTVKDRIVQMCCKMVIEPIFEADFEDCSYGFRPKRSAHDAITVISDNLKKGKVQVYDADLSGYFDNIPHDKLMILVEQRISDSRILKLIRMWLKSPVYEDKQFKKNSKGTPQGGVISPLLANIYLNLVDKAVKRKGSIFQKYKIDIVRYADDFILMGYSMPSECLNYLHAILERMELTINTDKTHLLNARQEPFNFLGFTFRYVWSSYNKNKKWLRISPTKESIMNIRQKVGNYLRYNGRKNPYAVSKGLNSIMRGWLNYIIIPDVSYSNSGRFKLENYLWDRLRRYYKRKSQRASKLYRQGAFEVLTSHYGLIDPIIYKLVDSRKCFR